VEILRGPWTCFDAREYHALLIVDPEEAFGTKEVQKLTVDIRWVMYCIVLYYIVSYSIVYLMIGLFFGCAL
jgi:hypothetical protein